MTELELRERELELRREDLELQRARLFVEFARFGFAGTLTAGIAGLLLIFGLAALSASTAFKIDGWALVAIGFTILIGVTTFGYLSLWQAPNLAAKFGREMQIRLSPTDRAS
jgi:hypothetical protein